MKGLVQFDTGDGGSVVVEIDDDDPGFVRAGAGEVVARAQASLNEALEVLRPIARAVIQKVDNLEVRKPSGVEVQMGIKLNAKMGAVLASTEGECHIQLKLSWAPPATPTPTPT